MEMALNVGIRLPPLKKFARSNPTVFGFRQCTDLPFLFFFLLFTVGWILIGLHGWSNGKPERILFPTDSWGNPCGRQRPALYDMSEKPFLLFFDLTKCISYETLLTGCPTPQICVSKCPSKVFSYLSTYRLSPLEFQNTLNSDLFCHYSVNVNRIGNFSELTSLVRKGLCVSYTVPSASILGRCVPRALSNLSNVLEESLDDTIREFGNGGGLIADEASMTSAQIVVNAIADGVQRPTAEKLASDLKESAKGILGFVGIAAFVAFVWTIGLRFLGGMVVWLGLSVLLMGLAGGAVFSALHYRSLLALGAVSDFSFQPTISAYLDMPDTWLYLSIFLGTLAIISFLVILSVRSRISLSVALIGESSRALRFMPSTLIFPIIPFILHIIIFAVWATNYVLIMTLGDEECRFVNSDGSAGDLCDCRSEGNCRFVGLVRPEQQIISLQLYNLFLSFWWTCFVSALCDMSVAGTFASFYFAQNKPADIPQFPVLSSMWRSLRYHIGSLALGSLIISAVRMIVVILEFLYSRLKGYQNRVAQMVFRVLSWAFWLLEKVLKFISKNSYILTAIHGNGFCRSSRDSFSLLSRNMIRVVVVGRVTAFLLFIGKLIVSLGTVEDFETNDGSTERPYYMSSSLRKLLSPKSVNNK